MAPSSTLTVAPARTGGAHAPSYAAPARPRGVAINRPTMKLSNYKALKAAALRAPSMSKPRMAGPQAPSAPTANGFDGINKAGSDGWFPPDVNGAVGASYNALTTNDRYVVYSKSTTPTVKKNVTLNTLFGYGTESAFDPRVVFDTSWSRFVASTDFFAESSSVQNVGIAITKSNNAAGATWNYVFNGEQICGSDVFVDYPQISTSQDAVIFTVNCFRNSDGAYLGSAMIGIAKALLYNGKGFSVPVFRYFSGTATPPNVLDGNPRAHVLVTGGGTSVREMAFTNPGSAFYATLGPLNAISGFQTIVLPPNGRQPNCSTTSCQVDSGDGRFVSPSTQVNDDLWNVTTLGLGGGTSFASPYWGDFDVEGAGADTTKQFGTRFLNGSSDDYNASLVAGADGRMFMNWSSSGPSTFITQTVAARKSTDAANSLPILLVAKSSTTTLVNDFDANFGVQRFGDTSQITRDTANATTAWAWNEWSDGGSWGTHAAKFINP